MSKQAASILAVLSLIVGAFAGGFCVAAVDGRNRADLIISYKHHENQMTIGTRTSDANIRVYELRHLRAGAITNVIEWEELYLEADLIALEPFVAEQSDFRSEPSNIRALKEVRDYRAEFPYKTAPSGEASVAEVFTLLDERTNH